MVRCSGYKRPSPIEERCAFSSIDGACLQLLHTYTYTYTYIYIYTPLITHIILIGRMMSRPSYRQFPLAIRSPRVTLEMPTCTWSNLGTGDIVLSESSSLFAPHVLMMYEPLKPVVLSFVSVCTEAKSL